MDCLRDYIGLRGCGLPTPASGMYLNALAGIEFNEIESIANADQQSFVGVFNDIQERAIERFRVDVIGRLSGFDKRYKLRQITQTVDLAQDINTNVTIPASVNRRGIVLELQNAGDVAICSNMQALYIQSVQFYLVNNGDFIVNITDADSGVVLDTYSYTSATNGWNWINVDKQYDVQRISITVDCTNVVTVTQDLSQFNLSGFASNALFSDWGYNGGLWVSYDCAGTAQVRGITTDLNNKNATFGENAFGISAVFSVRCTYNGIVCKNKRYFASAFRLLLGIELMAERMYTSRINKWTTVDAKKAEKLRTDFEVQYRGGVLKNGDIEVSYEGELNQAIQFVDLNLSDCCIECDESISWRETQM